MYRWMGRDRRAPSLTALALVVTSVFVTACGDPGAGERPGLTSHGPTSTSSSASIPPGAAVPVSISRTGGFAGVSQRIEIAADGSWTYTDRRASVQQGKLTPEQLSSVQQRVNDPAFASQLNGSGGPKTCNDTFIYQIVAGEKRGAFDDCDAAVKPAVVAVVAAVAAATPF